MTHDHTLPYRTLQYTFTNKSIALYGFFSLSILINNLDWTIVIFHISYFDFHKSSKGSIPPPLKKKKMFNSLKLEYFVPQCQDYLQYLGMMFMSNQVKLTFLTFLDMEGTVICITYFIRFSKEGISMKLTALPKLNNKSLCHKNPCKSFSCATYTQWSKVHWGLNSTQS